MATYDQLMVYKHAYDLTVELMQVTKKMDRGFKFTLGERINNACVEMLICVYRINISSEREQFFLKAREQVELIRLLLRLMKDLKVVSTFRFAALNEYVESISKQLAGWHKGSKSAGPGKAQPAQKKIF